MCLVFVSLMLFVPIQNIAFPGLAGQEPCVSLHATCSTLSPPIPWFRHCGRCFCEREERAGRESRSKWESPIRKLVLVGLMLLTHCAWNFPPHVTDGLDLLTWPNARGDGSIDG